MHDDVTRPRRPQVMALHLLTKLANLTPTTWNSCDASKLRCMLLCVCASCLVWTLCLH